jgi:hypothetical protein
MKTPVVCSCKPPQELENSGLTYEGQRMELFQSGSTAVGNIEPPEPDQPGNFSKSNMLKPEYLLDSKRESKGDEHSMTKPARFPAGRPRGRGTAVELAMEVGAVQSGSVRW